MIQKFLGTEIDKSGHDIEIYRVDKLSMSPVYTFFLRQMSFLIDSGYAYPMTTWNDHTCGAVYAMKDEQILGHIVYNTSKPGILWITLSAVDIAARGRGIYTILHRYFEQTAKELGCQNISSHIHVKNSIRLSSAEKVEMHPTMYYMSKRIT